MRRANLLLLPGLLCDSTVWRDQIRGLGSHADCHVPDYGSRDSLTAMAHHVLASAPGGSFALAGHSMGGRVALEVVRLAPHRVERIALLDTGYQRLPTGAAGEQEKAGRMALLEQARAAGMRVMGQAWARGMVHATRLGTPVFDEILDMIERRTPAIFAAQIEALLHRPDATSVLKGLAGPTLVACGRDDQWSPLARHRQMAALIPGARLAVIEDSGHMTTMEQPEAVTRLLLQWLGEKQNF
jgi:pimeloyl-ACP methyl ester carboxylesterase